MKDSSTSENNVRQLLANLLHEAKKYRPLWHSPLRAAIEECRGLDLPNPENKRMALEARLNSSIPYTGKRGT